MRSTRALVMIGLSVLAGFAAVFLAMNSIATKGGQTVPVIVASRDVDLGSALKPTMVEAVGWPKGSEPKGAISEASAVEGRILKISVVRGEPIIENKLAPVGSTGGLSAIIKEGKRAVTVKVNEVVGVAGFALPGNYVDVMVNAPDEKNRPISKIVLEHILVLAVAQENKQDQTAPRVVSAVTLEVTPDDAERLDLARSIGSLSLVLRNQMDDQLVATEGARKNDILNQHEVAEEAKPAAPVVAATPPKRPVRAAPRPAVQKITAPPAVQKVVEDEKLEVIRGLQKSVATH